MAQPVGTRIGPYEIVALLGAGGMGEVYRARDAKLNRDVAIKVLLPSVANDPDRLARFSREAQVLASLNHPNIAHIHGLEDANGVTALVMELVEGEDLAERIANSGRIPIDDALRIARQIADALEAAHAQGIVHRDLKPANIRIRPDGTVKVLDFGLAKAIAPDGAIATADAMNSPTLSVHATKAGIILGTVAYMSPEQARGRPVDKRSDIWAFGCVLYEMLTGRRAFEGQDVSEIAAAVIKDEPRWDGVPAAALRLLKKCLQKDPTRRLRDIGDAWELLEEVPDPSAHARARAAWRFGAVAWGAAALALTALAALSFVHFREQSPAAEPVRFQIPAPDNAAITSLSVSPDGRQVAFTARAADGRNLLWVRSLDTIDARPQRGIESGPDGLFWSPDSRWIGFATPGKLKKVEASGGPAQPVCDFQGDFLGAAWSRSGVIIFGTNNSGLMQVSERGGAPAPLVVLEHPGALEFQGYPTILPDDRHFLYQRYSSASGARGIYLGSLNAKPEQQESRRLLSADAPAAYATSNDTRRGHLIFRRDTSLMAQVFDTDRLALVGDAVRIGDGLSTVAGPPPYSASSTGVLVYRVGTLDESQLRWYDRKGQPLNSVGPPGDYNDVQLSPDGTKVVTDMGGAGGTVHLWTADTTRGVFSRLNPGDNADFAPALGPDRRVVFSLFANGSAGDIYRTSASGVGAPELLVKSELQKHPNHISLDGRFLIYDVHTLTMGQDLWVLPLAGDRKPVPFLTTPADETFGQFSPDGKWIAYSSDESGRRDVYVQGFAPGGGSATAVGKWQISTAGGDKPRWRRDGQELYYIAPDGKMMAVPVKSGATFEPGAAIPLFETHVAGFFPYDVSPDGRFLINTVAVAAMASSSPITVVLNWQTGLSR